MRLGGTLGGSQLIQEQPRAKMKSVIMTTDLNSQSKKTETRLFNKKTANLTYHNLDLEL